MFFNKFSVSYEVIQILLEHPDLIEMLADCPAKLHCLDNRLKQEEIANFRHVINPLSLTSSL